MQFIEGGRRRMSPRSRALQGAAAVVALAATSLLAGSPAADARTFVVPTNVRDCTDCSVPTRSRPRSLRYVHPDREPRPLGAIVVSATGVRWHRWGSPRASTGKRRFLLSTEGQAEPDRIRAVIRLTRRKPRPADGCGYPGGGRTYTRATIRILSGSRAGARLRLDLPPTGCETF